MSINKISVKDSKSIVGFETSGGGDWKVWDRYLTLDGKRAYYLGNICGTCVFLFKRLDGANTNISPKEISIQLRNGISNIDKVVNEVTKIMPDEEYYVNLININPKLVSIGSEDDYFSNEQIKVWGLDGFYGFAHHPMIHYYRGKTVEFTKNKMLYEFIVPMFPQGWLEEETIDEYKNLFNQGVIPTALSISILDIKQHYDSDVEHWCLSHYILDGHHKIFTASQVNKPLSLISFLAINKGVSSLEEINVLLNFLN